MVAQAHLLSEQQRTQLGFAIGLFKDALASERFKHWPQTLQQWENCVLETDYKDWFRDYDDRIEYLACVAVCYAAAVEELGIEDVERKALVLDFMYDVLQKPQDENCLPDEPDDSDFDVFSDEEREQLMDIFWEHSDGRCWPLKEFRASA